MTPTATLPTTYDLDSAIGQYTAAEYDHLVETGVLTSTDRVELLETFVVRKMPRTPPHDGTIQILQRALIRAIPPGWDVRTQLTVALPDSRPEPDFAIVRGDERTYLTQHPTATDVALLIEVANSSLLRDQRDKARIYARAGIAIYWIVNLDERRIEVHSAPSGPTTVPAYLAIQHHHTGESVPLLLHGTLVGTLSVAALLP